MPQSILFNIIKYFSVVSILFPLLVGVLKWKTLDKVLRVLFLYVLISVLADGISILLARQRIFNYEVRNSFTLLEFACLTYIYFLKFNSQKVRNGIIIFCVSFMIAAIYIFSIKSGFSRQDNLLSTIEAGFFIILAHTYTYFMFKELSVVSLLDDTFFWINNAIMIYFSANFVLFLFYGYIERFGVQNFYLLHGLHLLSNITFNIMLAIGLWKIKHK